MNSSENRTPKQAALARAFSLLQRLDSTTNPARSMTRASAKLAWLARNGGPRAIYWLSNAVNDHKHACLAARLGHEQEMVAHVVRRDRALELFARRSAQQL